jgi:hypothetical protein
MGNDARLTTRRLPRRGSDLCVQEDGIDPTPMIMTTRWGSRQLIGPTFTQTAGAPTLFVSTQQQQQQQQQQMTYKVIQRGDDSMIGENMRQRVGLDLVITVRDRGMGR